jgi:hypothetical protein
MSQSQGHSAAGRITAMKNSNDNRQSNTRPSGLWRSASTSCATSSVPHNIPHYPQNNKTTSYRTPELAGLNIFFL